VKKFCDQCGVEFEPPPHVGDRQKRCGKAACHRAARAEWSRLRYWTDSEFRRNMKRRALARYHRKKQA